MVEAKIEEKKSEKKAGIIDRIFGKDKPKDGRELSES